MARLPGLILRLNKVITFSGANPEAVDLDFSALGAFSVRKHYLLHYIRVLFPGGEEVAQADPGHIEPTYTHPGYVLPATTLTDAKLTHTGTGATTKQETTTGGTPDYALVKDMAAQTVPTHVIPTLTIPSKSLTSVVRSIPWIDFRIETDAGISAAEVFGDIVLTPEDPKVMGDDVPHITFPIDWDGKVTISPGNWTNPSTAPTIAARYEMAVRNVTKEEHAEVCNLLKM